MIGIFWLVELLSKLVMDEGWDFGKTSGVITNHCVLPSILY